MTETVFPRGQPTGGVRRSRSPSPVKTGSSSKSLSDRHMLTGSLVDRAAPEKSHVQKERCVLARAMWLYIQENRGTGYTVKWSEWLEAHSRTVTMQVGDKLEGNGFSSTLVRVLFVFSGIGILAYFIAALIMPQE